MYVLSVIAFIGGTVLMLWSAYVTWTERRGWPARLWSLVLALSALVLLQVAYTQHFMAFVTRY
jgi:hypothetical protein